MRERGWAAALLCWEFRPPLLTAETSAARYVLAAQPHEILAHAEIRDPGGSYRVEVGSFRDIVAAKVACELHAAALCRRADPAERLPVSVAISNGRGGAPRGNRNGAKHKAVREPAAADIDAALASWADVLADEG